MDFKSKLERYKKSLKLNSKLADTDKLHQNSNEKPFNSSDWVILKLDTSQTWKTYGPWSTKVIKNKLKINEITPTDYCWMSGWKEWKQIFEVSEFYFTQKPPLELNFNKIDENENLFKSKNLESQGTKISDFNEVPLKKTPLQYLGWKYKSKKTESNKFDSINENHRHSNMPEPWVSEFQKFDFKEDQNPPAIQSLETTSSDQNLDLTSNIKSSFKKMRFVFGFMLLISGLSLSAVLLYKYISESFLTQSIDMSLSYFVIEDTTMDLPKYMYARSDLKKGQSVKIRIFDAHGAQIKTKNMKAGLNLTSKGTGRIRIPIYPYQLDSGHYILKVEIEGQILEKEFFISKDVPN